MAMSLWWVAMSLWWVVMSLWWVAMSLWWVAMSLLRPRGFRCALVPLPVLPMSHFRILLQLPQRRSRRPVLHLSDHSCR